MINAILANVKKDIDALANEKRFFSMSEISGFKIGNDGKPVIEFFIHDEDLDCDIYLSILNHAGDYLLTGFDDGQRGQVAGRSSLLASLYEQFSETVLQMDAENVDFESLAA